MSKKISNLKIILLAAFLISTADNSHSVEDSWTPFPSNNSVNGGPWGGDVRRLLAVDSESGNDVWAAVLGGVYVWNSQKSFWRSKNNGLESLDVRDLASCSQPDESVRLAAATKKGVFFSEDRGEHWIKSKGYFSNSNAGQIAINPNDCGHIIAVTFGSPSILYESTDGGNKWDRINGFDALDFAFGNTGTLYFSTQEGSIYSWSVSEEKSAYNPLELVSFSGAGGVSDFLVLVGEQEELLVASREEGLWLSSDGAAKWPKDPQNYLNIETLSQDPKYPFNIIAKVSDPFGSAVYQSRDEGVSFKQMTLPEQGMNVQALLAYGGEYWLGESKSGIFKAGADRKFAHWSNGLAAFQVKSLAFAPDGSGNFIVAGGGSIYESGNAGAYLWEAETNAWKRWSLGSNAGTTRFVSYRGEDIWISGPGMPIYRSDDQGEYWEARNGDGGAAPIPVSERRDAWSFAFDKAHPSVVAAGMLSGVYVSDNGGWTWKKTLDKSSFNPWLTASVPGVFYVAGTRENSGVAYWSQDFGAAWTVLKTDEDNALPPINSIAAASFANDWKTSILLVGTEGGLFLWEDFSTGWQRPDEDLLSAPIDAVSVLAVNGSFHMAAYAKGVGVLYSGSGPAGPWERLSMEGLLLPDGELLQVDSLSFEPGGARIIAAVTGRGLLSIDLSAGSGFLTEGSVSVVNGIDSSAIELTLGLNEVQTEGAEMRFSEDLKSWQNWTSYFETVSWTSSDYSDGVRPVYVQIKASSGDVSPVYSVVLGNEPDPRRTFPVGGSGGGSGGGLCFIGTLN